MGAPLQKAREDSTGMQLTGTDGFAGGLVGLRGDGYLAATIAGWRAAAKPIGFMDFARLYFADAGRDGVEAYRLHARQLEFYRQSGPLHRGGLGRGARRLAMAEFSRELRRRFAELRWGADAEASDNGMGC